LRIQRETSSGLWHVLFISWALLSPEYLNAILGCQWELNSDLYFAQEKRL
jgi:hypothetical protein